MTKFTLSRIASSGALSAWARPTAALLGVALGACGGAQAQVATGEEGRPLELVHEACNLDGGRQVDVDGDGRADIWHVESGGREVCRAVDLNLDGVRDAFIYYDDAGRERRRESDYDRDGVPDEIALSEAGVVVRKERETNYDAKLDTWDLYEGGRLAKRERDSDGDGIIDQWWMFDRPEDPRCATVTSDHNQDRQPDPGSEVDLCGEGYKAPPPPTTPTQLGAPAAPSAAPGAAPPPLAPAPPTTVAAPSASAPSPAPPASVAPAPTAPAPKPPTP